MNINLNTLLNNLSGTTVDNGQNVQIVDSMQLTSSSDAGLAILQSLTEGDVISGQIIDINMNDVLLQLTQGVTIKAQLGDPFSLNIGDQASFIIADKSNNQIILKLDNQDPVSDVVSQAYEKSLKEAGLPVNDRNIELVKEFVKQNLPIDKGTLTEAARAMLLEPEAMPEDVAFLTKMNIPVNKQSIEMIHNLYDFNSNMEQDIKDISQGILQTAETFKGQEASKDVASFIDKTIETFNSSSQNEPVHSTVKQNTLNKLADDINEVIKDYVKQNSDHAPVNTDVILKKAEAITEQLRSGNIPAKEILHNIAELARELPDKASIHKLLKATGLNEVTQNMLRQELTIRPEEFSNESLKKAYAKTLTSMNEMETLLNNLNKKDSPLMQVMNGVAKSTEFVNNLNNIMSFVQIPLKMNSKTACGQLHVYKRNKSKKTGLEEQTAMLHLDMAHLGKVDVFVKLCNNNLTTNFSVESEDILEFIEAHFEELSKTLEGYGYNVSITGKTEQKESFNIKESVIKKEDRPVEISRLSFDVRA